MATSHSLRVRGELWDRIERKAWDMSMKANKVVKPTDIADALMRINLEKITLEEVEKIRTER